MGEALASRGSRSCREVRRSRAHMGLRYESFACEGSVKVLQGLCDMNVLLNHVLEK